MSSLLQPDEIIRLWPDGPPTNFEGVGPEIEYRATIGAGGETLMLRNISEAQLAVFRPAKPNGVGVIVCPGGGWRILTWEHEGLEPARWLTACGYTAFLLKYRLRGTPQIQAEFDAELAGLFETQAELLRKSDPPRRMSDIADDDLSRKARAAAADDGRRALAVARERASELGVDRDKVGMMGFSVGACLVADIAVDPRAAPLAFAAPIYGGDTGRAAPSDAPPLFTVVAQDDFLIHRIAESLYSEWTKARRPAELHVYRRGGHGFGVAKQGLPSDGWIEQFHSWLVDLGLG